MPVTVQVVFLGISLFYLPSLASPTNWFYDAPRALLGLAGSASASASAAVTPSSYIADFRNSDLKRKQEKLEQLRNEKDLTEQVELLDSNDDKRDDNGNGEEEDGEGYNEASPSFLEKKIGKILTKLRLIAQIKNAYHYNPEAHVHESNITFNITSVNSNRNLTSNVQNDDIKEDIDPRFANIRDQSENINPKPATENIESESGEKIGDTRNQSDNIEPVYGLPKEPSTVRNEKKFLETEPLRIQLDVNHINNNLDNFEATKSEKLKEEEPARFGTLGVFFAELLGSVVGLAYGALAQFTNGAQNPVTLSTSEGL